MESTAWQLIIIAGRAIPNIQILSKNLMLNRQSANINKKRLFVHGCRLVTPLKKVHSRPIASNSISQLAQRTLLCPATTIYIVNSLSLIWNTMSACHRFYYHHLWVMQYTYSRKNELRMILVYY